MRSVPSIAVLATGLLVSGIASAGPPDAWRLEQVVHGDIGVGGPPAITVDKVTVNDLDGEIEITACCYLDDCTGKNTYRMGWAIVGEHEAVQIGGEIRFTLFNELVSGSCQGVDPWIRPGGNDGFPAPIVEKKGVAIQGPNALFTGGGGEFHVDPTFSTHDPTMPRVVKVQDLGSHDGYWHIDFSQKWGLQYEVAFVYREDTGMPTTTTGAGGSGATTGTDATSGAGAGGSSDADSGSSSSCSFVRTGEPWPGGNASAAAAVALLALAARRRRR